MAGCTSAEKAVESKTSPDAPSAQNAPVPPQPSVMQPDVIRNGGGESALPKAMVYKTNGNYNNNVVARYNKVTRTFISFPGPTDVTVHSAPIKLADGWLLDREGMIGSNAVFLKWTYEEYHRLPAVPTIDELREAIIPGARVTEYRQLDITNTEAIQNPAQVEKLLQQQQPPTIELPVDTL